MDWSLYRYFLAVAETGNLSAAARRLKVSQPTVGRQVQELEKKLNARVFERGREGHRLTPMGEAILPLAKAIESAASSIERKVAGQDRSLAGPVRIAATECLGTFWLASKLTQFRDEYPDISLELVLGIPQVNLVRREADVVLRIGNPGSDRLVGRRLSKVAFGLFGSSGYLEANGVPATPEDLKDHVIIESSGAIDHLAQVRLLRELAGPAATAVECNSLPTQFAAAQQGVGLLPLPHYMAATDPDLRRVLTDDFDLSLDLWLLTHRDLRGAGRVRAVLEFLSREICRDRSRFVGGDISGRDPKSRSETAAEPQPLDRGALTDPHHLERMPECCRISDRAEALV